MEIIYLLLPVAVLLGLIGLILMIWALKTGQFEDMEGPAHRILYDDDANLMPTPAPGKPPTKEPTTPPVS